MNFQKQQEIFNVPLKSRTDSTSTNSNNSLGSEEKILENGFYCWHSTRYLILIISLICFSLTWGNALAYNYTNMCMDANFTKDESALKNGSAENSNFENAKTSFFSESALLIAAVAIGSIAGSICLPYACSKFGTRIVFTIFGFISAISTLLFPFAVSSGFPLTFAMRIGQGIANSIGIPGLGAVTTPWSPISSSGIFLSLLSTHLQFGPIFTMPLAGVFCDSKIGWQGIFYLQGGLTIIAFGAFFAIFNDSPKFHRNVSSKELYKINFGKLTNGTSKGLKIPYYKIFTDKSVLGVIIASIGAGVGFQVFNQYGPSYLFKVLNLNVKTAGIAAAIPFVFSLIVKIASGPISDKLTFLSQKTKVIMFASISQYFMAACFILLAWMPFKSSGIAQLFYTLALVFSGVNCVGVLKAIALQAVQYSYFLLILSAFINNVIVLILPFVKDALVPNDTADEWSIIFYAIGILLAVCVTIFNITCEIEPRSWTTNVKL